MTDTPDDATGGSIIGKIILGWVRHLIGMGAAAAVAQGYLDHGQSEELTGALVALVPLAFSAFDKWHALQAQKFAARTGVVPGGAK